MVRDVVAVVVISLVICLVLGVSLNSGGTFSVLDAASQPDSPVWGNIDPDEDKEDRGRREGKNEAEKADEGEFYDEDRNETDEEYEDEPPEDDEPIDEEKEYEDKPDDEGDEVSVDEDEGDTEGWRVIEFKTKLSDPPFQTPYRSDFTLTWPMIIFPAGKEDIEKQIPLPGDFRIQRRDKRYYVDRDGDGKPDMPIGRSKQGTKVVLDLIHLDDSRAQYQVFFATLERERAYEQTIDVRDFQVTVFAYRRACYTEGEIDGEKVYLVDDNSNGEYDDYGYDSIVIGNSGESTVLSKMVRIKGKLYHFSVENLSGTVVRIREYAGPTGELSLKYTGKVSPSWVIVGATGGKEGYFYNVAGSKNVTLPVGTYKLFGGRIVSGKGPREKSITIVGDMCAEFSVTRDSSVELKLGAPFKLDFQYSVQEGTLLVDPTSIAIFGCASERYTRFYPAPLRPKVSIRDATGKTVEKDEMKLLTIMKPEPEDPMSYWRRVGDSEDDVRYMREREPRFDFETLLRRLPFPEDYSWKVKRAKLPLKVMLQEKVELLGMASSEWK